MMMMENQLLSHFSRIMLLLLLARFASGEKEHAIGGRLALCSLTAGASRAAIVHEIAAAPASGEMMLSVRANQNKLICAGPDRTVDRGRRKDDPWQANCRRNSMPATPNGRQIESEVVVKGV